MNKFDEILDACIDRINNGESIEDCLANYPDYAEELQPLLSAIFDLRDVGSDMPGITARTESKRRFNAAAENLRMNRQVESHSKLGRIASHLPGRAGRQRQSRRRPILRRGLAMTAAALTVIVALIVIGITTLWPGSDPVIEQGNFRLMISDEVNSISDFSSLNVWISSIGVKQSGESDDWITLEPTVSPVDLVLLQGLNAQEIWSGDLPDGQYTKVFIYVDKAEGILKTGDSINVMLPSGKIQISKPFSITSDGNIQTGSTVHFVYDITVIKASQSSKYVLQPQIEQSGADQAFHEVERGELVTIVEGTFNPGEDVIISVQDQGNPVTDADVEINDKALDESTDENGTVSYTIPSDEDELKIKVKSKEKDSQIKIKLGTSVKKDQLDIEITPDNLVPGESATICVTSKDGPVENALVIVNDTELPNRTDKDGYVSFTVPTEDEIEIEVISGTVEEEIKVKKKDKLTIEIDGDLIIGMEATACVKLNDSPVEGAAVTVNDVYVGTTDGSGTVPFDIPSTDINDKKLRVKASLDDLEKELKINIEEDLVLQLQSNIVPGEIATLYVSICNIPMQGVTVSINGDALSNTTDEDGLITFVVPDKNYIKIVATLGELTGKLNVK